MLAQQRWPCLNAMCNGGRPDHVFSPQAALANSHFPSEGIGYTHIPITLLLTRWIGASDQILPSGLMDVFHRNRDENRADVQKSSPTWP
jgi:hypothetical protein